MRLVDYLRSRQTKKALLPVLVLTSGFLLVGCKPEEEPPPPPPPVEVLPVTYDEMKIKRDKFNADLYVHAQEQQYIEIEAPYMKELIERIKTRDAEVLEVFDTELISNMRFNSEFNNTDWLLGIQSEYQKDLDDLLAGYAETHPDGSPAHKKAYGNLTTHISNRLEARIVAIQTIIVKLGKKGTPDFSPSQIRSDIEILLKLLEKNQDLMSVFKVYDEAIRGYFEMDKIDDTPPPMV